MLEFIAATYNEEERIDSLLASVYHYVDRIRIVDDGSTDKTTGILWDWVQSHVEDKDMDFYVIEHTGLPETVKRLALEEVYDDSWVLMLDADERIMPKEMEEIKDFVQRAPPEITHVWFDLIEFIDHAQTRVFLKCRLFRKNAVRFSDTIHEDDTFVGQGANFHWKVWHSKTRQKQELREREYIETYKKLLAEGKITQEWAERAQSFHYFIKDKDLTAHG